MTSAGYTSTLPTASTCCNTPLLCNPSEHPVVPLSTLWGLHC
jgi:hypothetical protein